MNTDDLMSGFIIALVLFSLGGIVTSISASHIESEIAESCEKQQSFVLDGNVYDCNLRVDDD